MAIRAVIFASALGLVATRLVAQADTQRWLADCRHDWNDRPKVCAVREAGFHPAGGTLTVDPSENGGVSVYGWDRDSIGVVAMIEAYGNSDETARQIVDGIHIEASGRAIRATGPETDRHESFSVSFDVYVPRHTDLSLESINGPLSVEDVTGSMQLRSQNGPLSLRGVAGDVTARVQNGPLSVALSGSHWDGPGLDAEAQNGPVDLSIPDRYNARLETGTVNGPMDLNFPLTVTVQGHVTNRIRTTLGDGGSPVRVVTTNGPLTIRHTR
jgi:DUF4097 and DUF4098 domain-containing protein YvlB